MSITELIKDLEIIREREGDLPCYQYEDYGIDHEPEWHSAIASIRGDWLVDYPQAKRETVCVCFGSYSGIDVKL